MLGVNGDKAVHNNLVEAAVLHQPAKVKAIGIELLGLEYPRDTGGCLCHCGKNGQNLVLVEVALEVVVLGLAEQRPRDQGLSPLPGQLQVLRELAEAALAWRELPVQE